MSLPATRPNIVGLFPSLYEFLDVYPLISFKKASCAISSPVPLARAPFINISTMTITAMIKTKRATRIIVERISSSSVMAGVAWTGTSTITGAAGSMTCGGGATTSGTTGISTTGSGSGCLFIIVCTLSKTPFRSSGLRARKYSPSDFWASDCISSKSASSVNAIPNILISLSAASAAKSSFNHFAFSMSLSALPVSTIPSVIKIINFFASALPFCFKS